jgi:formylglycine-generating enzyme required for sulfatase activity
MHQGRYPKKHLSVLVDPCNVTDFENAFRVCCGGAWHFADENCTMLSRQFSRSWNRSNETGFRLVFDFKKIS